jgi:hypothetical protein
MPTDFGLKSNFEGKNSFCALSRTFNSARLLFHYPLAVESDIFQQLTREKIKRLRC